MKKTITQLAKFDLFLFFIKNIANQKLGIWDCVLYKSKLVELWCDSLIEENYEVGMQEFHWWNDQMKF